MCSNKNGWNRSPFIGCDAILSAAVHKASILDDDEGSARKDASDICRAQLANRYALLEDPYMLKKYYSSSFLTLF